MKISAVVFKGHIAGVVPVDVEGNAQKYNHIAR